MKRITLLFALWFLFALPAYPQTVIVVKSVEVTGYSIAGGTVQLTVSSDRPIKWDATTTTAKGVIATVNCTVANGRITIPDVPLLSTYNAFDDSSKDARFSASLGGQAFKGFESFQLRIVNTQTSWIEIADENVRLRTQPNNRSRTTIDPLTIAQRKTERINANVLVLGSDAAEHDAHSFTIYAGSKKDAPAFRYNPTTEQWEFVNKGTITTIDNKKNLTRDQIASLTYDLGTEFRTCGFAACNDGGTATYMVQASAAPYTVDGYGVIGLANGKFAVMRPEDGMYNVLAFGAKYSTSLDSTTAIQRAVDFQALNARSGVVFFPEAPNPTQSLLFSKVYVNSGNRLLGQGISSTRTSATATTRYGARLKVLAGGLGFVIGNRTHSDLNTSLNWRLENLLIEGQTGSISGIRFGSDVSFKGPAQQGEVARCELRGFTDATVAHPIYDKSSIALGQADTDYYGTFSITGAAAVFCANLVNITMTDVVLENNYYGFAESSGGKSTTLRVQGGYWSQNIKSSIYLTTLKSATFEDTVIEGCTAEAVILRVPSTPVPQLRTQMYGIRFIRCHFEQNNLQRRDDVQKPKTYTLVIDNENSGSAIRDVYIDSSISAPYGHAIYSRGGRNVIISKRLDVTAGDNALFTLSSEAVVYTDEIQANAVYNIDNQTLLTRDYFAIAPKFYGRLYGKLSGVANQDAILIENSAGNRVLEASTLPNGHPRLTLRDDLGNVKVQLKTDGIDLAATITPAGTTGNQTIHKPLFTVNFAPGASTLNVTNNLAGASSVCLCTVQTNDGTLKSVTAELRANLITLTGNAAATAETKVACEIKQGL